MVGQSTIKTILQNAVRLGKPAHAYLFCGPRGVGKTTLARILAKAVNCLELKDGEPCTTCANCAAVQQGRFLDLMEIDAASYTGVDNIRDIIEHVKFSPSIGRYKVFIVDEVHMLSKAAFNALLKTLEEPPAHAIFILATTEIHKVPATIISRSQRFDFRRMTVAEILEVFAKIIVDTDLSIEPEALKLIAEAADGGLRDGLSILDQVVSFGSVKIKATEVEDILGLARLAVTQRFLDFLIAGDQAAAVKLIKDLSFEGRDLVQFNRGVLEYLRLVLLVKVDQKNLAEAGAGKEESQKLAEQAAALTAPKLMAIIRELLEAYRQSKLAPVAEMPLLMAALTLTPENNPPQPPLNFRGGEEGALSSSNSNPQINLTLDLGTIVDRWAEVLAKIKEYNHWFISSMRLGRILRLEQADLVMVFPYGFHRDILDARKNRIVVEQVLEEVFGLKLRVKLLLEKDLKEENDLVSEAVKILGRGE